MATKDNGLIDAPSVESWIEAHEPGGIEKLYHARDSGKLAGPASRFVSKYLWSRDPAEMTAAEARGELRFARLMKSARRSIKWAFIAAALGLLTLLATSALLLREWPGLFP